ncbi:MAG: hypothetical protein ACRDYA_17555 [Egibacteraceae bacterium]
MVTVLARSRLVFTVVAVAGGRITWRANGFYRVFVYAGKDSLTGKERWLTGTAVARSKT